MRLLARSILALCAVLSLAGCVQDTAQSRFASATPYSTEWCEAAKALPNSGPHLFSVGQCHDRDVAGFPRNEEVSLFYYAQAARWGSVDAGAELARLNRPVPDADLLAAARERADRERHNQQMAAAISTYQQPVVRNRPLSALEQQQLNHERMMGRAPPAMPAPSFHRPAVAAPRPVVPQSSFQQHSQKESTSTRRNCTNGVCRTERTTCVNGACRTTIEN